MRSLTFKHDHDVPSLSPTPPTAAEDAKLPALRSAVRAQTAPAASQHEEATYLTDATLVRYLRARNGDIPKAAAMLHTTISFARDHPAPFVCEACVRDPASHSFFPIGPALGSRPHSLADATLVMYSNFLVTNRDVAATTLHMQSAMEAAFDYNSLHRMVWVMDFQGFSRSDMSPAQAKRVLTLFANHYPERLGRAVIYDAPKAFSVLWSAVRFFAAPETIAKVCFVQPGEERKGFESAGVIGDTFTKLMEEIRAAREGGTAGSWWARPPIYPLVDYGARILEARGKGAA